jgi:hypothetical protein
MKFITYLKGEFKSRLEESGVLVVFDPEGRYEQVFDKLEGDECELVKGTGSTIQARVAAEKQALEMSRPNPQKKRMAIYVPRAIPESEEDKQMEPFAHFSDMGQAFPKGDQDSYHSLCRKAKAAHVAQIDRLFADGKIPDFETVDAVDTGSGSSWPRLRKILKAESAQDVVFKFLSAEEDLQKELNDSGDWVDEMKEFLVKTFELKLVTKAQRWRPIGEEMWRFLLLSEFVFDLPEDVPEQLATVPVAERSTEPLIYEICDRLRDNRRTRDNYVEQAGLIAEQLGLEEIVNNLSDFGDRDTFAFEERSFLVHYADAVKEEDFDLAREIEQTHRKSIWVMETEAVGEWKLVDQAFQLIQAVDDFTRNRNDPPSSMKELVECYVSGITKIDQLHRGLLQLDEDLIEKHEKLAPLVKAVTQKYEDLTGKYIKSFTSALTREGWPVQDLPKNIQVYSKFIKPAIQGGEKVAYFLIDSLRYELAEEIKAELERKHTVSLEMVSAQLPTITPVGMASLLPAAESNLEFGVNGDDWFPTMGGEPMKNVNDRKGWFKKTVGDQYMDTTLKDLIREGAQLKIPDSISLLVVRNTEIDAAGEMDASVALREIPRTLTKIRTAVNTLGDKGFNQCIIATDHGFHLRTNVEPGYKVPKPNGKWLLNKERCLIGDGESNDAVECLTPDQVDIPTTASHFVVPKSLGTFVEGRDYFHSGASLQECILPVITVRSASGDFDSSAAVSVRISYKRGSANKINTMRPMVEISYQSGDLFSQEAIQILLEARSPKDEVVGEAAIGKLVDPSTGLVEIEAGQTVKVAIRMNEDYEGAFTLMALDPDTNKCHDKIKLKTDYTL